MPNSVSPALVEPAPMAQTAILPSSDMITGRTATAIVPQFWQQVPGTATSVAAAADGSIWVLSDQPAGADRYIWHYSGGVWTNISGLAAHIAIAPNGMLWAVNAGGGIYSYSAGSWTALGGGASSITTASDNSIYVVSDSGSGADKGVWHNVAGVWSQVPGAGVSVFGSIDTSTHGTIAPGGFFILGSTGQITYENTDATSIVLNGLTAVIGSAPGGIFAIGNPPSGTSIYYYDFNTSTWAKQTGSGIDLSVNDGNLFVIGAGDQIYTTSITSVPASIVLNPTSLDLAGLGAAYDRTFTVTERGYAGTFSRSGNCAGIATFAGGNTGPSQTITVDGVAPGTCTQTFEDAFGQTAPIAVSVTTTGVIITKTR